MSLLAAQAKPVKVLALPSPALLLGGVWVWTIWSCAEHWQGNPNYSYGWAVPILAIGFVFRRYLLLGQSDSAAMQKLAPHLNPLPVIGERRQELPAGLTRREDGAAKATGEAKIDRLSLSQRETIARHAGAQRRREVRDLTETPSTRPMSILAQIGIALIAGTMFFALEYARNQIWHPEIVLWSICLIAVALTIGVFILCGGAPLARRELFPVLFFLTAVPWPPRFEQPIVSGLMRWVALTTTELLHWFGIEAQTSGAAIALRSGIVGISEACSGVRSLQAGIMFGLAMGEWFLLRPARRVILLFIAVALALVSNLIRTLALSLQAEWHGIESLDRAHDLIGNITITTLILAIWIGGKLLASRCPSRSGLSIEQIGKRLQTLVGRLMIGTGPTFRALTFSLLGIVAARSFSAWVDAKEQTQTAPLFSVKIDKSNQLRRIPAEIWHELRPSMGEHIRRQSAELPGGAADCFHFFWKPSPWNRFVLVHRPDVCMPGVGWKWNGPAEPVDISLGGQSIHCYLFRFRRGDAQALEVWGVWRNGQPIAIDYDPGQAMGTTGPSSLHLEGRRRSATEIIACSVIANQAAPSTEIAVALLRSVFEYKRSE